MTRAALLRSLLTATFAVGGASLAKADWFYCYSDDGANVYFSKLNSCPAAGHACPLSSGWCCVG
jgi:hypothetical protein